MSEPGFLAEVVEWFTDPVNWSGSFGVPARTLEHLQITAAAMAIAAGIALPVGMYIGHRRRFEFLIVSVGNVGRALPSFGLLLLFVIAMGLGEAPIVLTMTLLAIPPILINTYVGVQAVDPDALEAARGMGTTELGVLGRIELPLAARVILAGLRIATVQVIATATLAAVAGGGGLGRYIVDGFAGGDDAQLFSGAVLVAALALAIDGTFLLLQRLVTPRTTSSGAPAEVAEPVLVTTRGG
ncbi:MAG TPA: ABC transporter permease subunit [Actinomycetota bacterium]|nr:ABC transporter permease subunit [Actinomycetota bacterium]